MDHFSVKLMEDIVCAKEPSNKQQNSAKTSETNDKLSNNIVPVRYSHLKVELQTLRIPLDAEQQLYDTLKQIYGSDFKLINASEFRNKKSNLEKQYWMERGNLVIRGVVDYSLKNATPKAHEQLTKHFATSKLESYSFHSIHCTEALTYTDGNVGKALEILFEKYYQVKVLSNSNVLDNMDDLLECRSDEKLALESIYGDMFVEKIKNQLWLVKLKLNYLLDKKMEPIIKQVSKKSYNNRQVCKYIYGKCKFGMKCRFSHQQPNNLSKNQKYHIEQNPVFTLEIRFPDNSKYPHEPPYIYFYRDDMLLPSMKYLMIAKKLYDDALIYCANGEPCLFTLISLLENEDEMLEYLNNNEPNFIGKHETLFQKVPDFELQSLNTHHQLGKTNRQTKDNITSEEINRQDDIICTRYLEKHKNHVYKKMLECRKKLPAWSMMNEILETIHKNQVTIISGETGCGKSTQIPQFLLDDWIINRSVNKNHIEIVCTQPRRISAIGVAERVASERDEKIGNTIGYQIRLETKLSNWTRLTFCTTGILLQRLSRDSILKSVTHVIVDEVHERTAESDFLLMLLKELLSKRPDIKIILMSATLKAQDFSLYFGGAPTLNIPGRTFPVEQIFLEEIIGHVNYIIEENSKFTRKVRGGFQQIQDELETSDVDSLSTYPPKTTILDENLKLAQLMGRYPDYSQQTYKNLYLIDPDVINHELVEKILEWIVNGEHNYPREGSILVFLPGLAEISTIRDILNDNKIFSPKNGNFIIIPLHSSLSSEEQSLIFKKTNDKIRKIVLSTNIAETSVTIDDCVFVVDTGKMKEMRFNSNQNMESLEICWVSHANAMQRKGRAGRVMPGVCIHLFTSHRFNYHLLPQPVPEILRIPLEPLLLRIQMMYSGQKIDIYNILNKMLEPPIEQNITDAITRLQDVGAFDSEYNLTPLGHHLAALPVDVRIGKLILYGTIFCCLDSALTIAACLSHKSPFSTPFDKRHLVDAKKKEFSTAFSDQLTTLKAYKKWLDMCSRSTYAGQIFAHENFLSIKTLQTIADIKHQFLELLVSIGFVPIDITKRPMGVDKVLEFSGPELNANNDNLHLLQGLLCGALYPNVVKIFTPEKSFHLKSSGAIPRQPKPEELKFQTKKDGYVSIHPSSVNFSIGHFPSPYLVYQDKVKTSKIFIREISVVSKLPLVLFSGYGINIEQHDGSFILSLADGWILFAVESHTVAQLLQHMRIELIKLLEQKMQDPLLNLVNHQNGRKIIQTILGSYAMSLWRDESAPCWFYSELVFGDLVPSLIVEMAHPYWWSRCCPHYYEKSSTKKSMVVS
ncbi:hypothetical protein PV326_005105 [Microctonus aethiopoides]|nr:hypothetical protein PV326_005105 [Microctonus aethiopoides]